MRTLAIERGFTLVEMATGLAIGSILLALLASTMVGQVRIPTKIKSELKASQQIQKATTTLTEDANVAQSFTSGTEPDYGTFSWYEFSAASPVPVSARYYWEEGRVLREHTRGDWTSPPQEVMAGIAQYSDVTFTHTPPSWVYAPATKLWDYTEGKIGVDVTTTHDAGSVFQDTVFTAQLVSDLRPQVDRPVPIPGRLEPPTPPANQVDFRIAGNPTLITGSYRSGTGADLTYDDTSYYVTRGAGSPRTIVWEATSEVIDYTTITDITVEFTGQTNSVGVSRELFIYNPNDPAHIDGGYDTSPDEAGVYPSSGTDTTAILTFAADDVAYVDSLASKVVKIKLRATSTSTFDLRADQLTFKVAGTPAATFYRDYVLEADPTLELGSFVGGDFVSLGTDDTSYYTVQEVGDLVQWVAVSQPITLDSLSSVEVIFTAQVSKGNPVQEVFVFNPANGGDGYPLTPDSQATYASINTDATVSFFLSAADLTYVNSLFPKEVRIRVKASDLSVNWQLKADQLLFRAKP